MKTLFVSVVISLGILVIGCGNNKADDQTNKQTAQASKENTMPAIDYRQIQFNTITGEKKDLDAFKGHVLLLVNTASECGYTKQYAGLEKLYEAKKDKGFIIIGFPANNFGGQEPGTNEEIQKFCTSKFGVTFPMMAKISVKGDDIHPLYRYLTEKSPFPGDITWNFNKFLLDPEGNVVARYESAVTPEDKDLNAKIDELLSKIH